MNSCDWGCIKVASLTKAEEQQVWNHFPMIDEKMIDYATNEALKGSKYIFVSSGKMKKGYCTHCHASFYVEEAVKQNASATCPKCDSKCTYKKDWLGRKYLTDSAYFLWFEKSLVNPKAIVASWVYCSRNYSGAYKDVKTVCKRMALYTFELGKSEMYEVYTWHNDKLEKRGSIYNYNTSSLLFKVSIQSLIDAILGTPFEYSGWEKYSHYTLLKYLALFSEMPNIEILSKNGFKNVVEAKIHGNSLHRTINWKAFKLHDFFKISKQDYLMMKRTDATGIHVMHAPDFAIGLWMWQQARKEKSKMSYEKIIKGCNTFNVYAYFSQFKKIKRYCTIHRIFNYAQKQFELSSKHYMLPSQVLVTWSDYINDCMKLELNLDDEVILYPKNLKKAHEKTIKLIKIKNDEIANLKIQKRYEALKHFVFESDGLIIRPPETFKEIVDEGKKLKHCVGTYADRYSKGECTLLFVRKKDAPSVPFYTVELRGSEVAQVRGRNNKPSTKDVQAFIDTFKKQKLTKKARKAV